MLNDNKLWEHIKGLEGKTIHTLKRRKPNKISSVTDNTVVIANRKSKPSRAKISSLYKQVHKTNEVVSCDAQLFTYAVIYAILVEALPGEIEAIPGKPLGIRLRRQ